MRRVIDVCDDPVQLLVALEHTIWQTKLNNAGEGVNLGTLMALIHLAMVKAGLATERAIADEEVRAARERAKMAAHKKEEQHDL